MKPLVPLVLLLVIGIVGVIAVTVLKQMAGSKATTGKLPYRKKMYLLTKAERSFFGVLLEVIGSDYHVFCKIRLADLLEVEGKGGQRQSFFNQIKSKHVDFVLCDRNQVSPLLAIELDDASHQAANRQGRDFFMDKALADAGLPLLRVPAQQSYQPRSLADLIVQKIASVPPVIK